MFVENTIINNIRYFKLSIIFTYLQITIVFEARETNLLLNRDN